MKPVDGWGPSLPPTSLTVQAPLVYPQGYVESSLRADIGCPADLPEILHSAAREPDPRLPAAPRARIRPKRVAGGRSRTTTTLPSSPIPRASFALPYPPQTPTHDAAP